jgi:hypothetical protein
MPAALSGKGRNMQVVIPSTIAQEDAHEKKSMVRAKAI